MTPQEMEPREIKLYCDPVLQAHFRKVLGKWKDYDLYIETWNDIRSVKRCTPECDGGMWPRAPLPIDPINPERGLWGMIEGRKTLQEDYEKGQLKVKFRAWLGMEVKSCVGETPTEALLLALKSQLKGGNHE